MNERDESKPIQPPLFEIQSAGEFGPQISSIAPLTPSSELSIARYWFKRHLEQSQYPANTVSAYINDLRVLEQTVGSRRIDRITSRDIARYLGDANTRATRKRRLTSVSQLFKWLTLSAKMLTADPTESFYPDHIPLKTPRPLLESEQQALLEAAQADSSRSALMLWLLLGSGLTRGELLGLRVDHIDTGDPARPIIYIYYDNARWQAKERKLVGDAQLTELFEAYRSEFAPEDMLFDMLPQSVNKLIERLARAAKIGRTVSPQTLRDSWAVAQAAGGADQAQLLALLGLAEDARNLASVSRYIKLAAPPVNAARESD